MGFMSYIPWGPFLALNALPKTWFCISNTTKEPELTLHQYLKKSKQVQASKCSISAAFLEKVLNQKLFYDTNTFEQD